VEVPELLGLGKFTSPYLLILIYFDLIFAFGKGERGKREVKYADEFF
jgi:hypothetical protein